MAGSAGGTLKVLQISDAHLHASEDGRMRGVNTHSTFTAVLAHAQRDRRWPADLVLVTGDIVQDESRAGYERFRAIMAALGPPVLCLPGNHDDPKLMTEILSAPPVRVGGVTRFGDWSVILLSTFLTGEDAGGLGAQRLHALDAALRENSRQHVMVCMHHQPLPMWSAWLDGVGLRDANKFLEVIDAHSNVRCIAWGHVHQASDRERNGIRYLSAPSTCAQFLPRSEFFALDSSPPGMRWIELHSDGSITTTVEWLPAAAV